MDHPAAGANLHDVHPRLDEKNLKVNDTAFCATPADSSFILNRRTTAAKPSIGSMIQQGIVRHQLGISLNLVFLLGLTYTFFASLRPQLEPFFCLQHPMPSGLYSQGLGDVWIVLSFVVFFTGLRALLMDYVLTPLAKSLGVKKGKMRRRFAEQSYMMIYYGFFWSVGLRLFIADTPSFTGNTAGEYISHLLASLWRGFPRLGVEAAMKWYYLAQTAFWFQQVLVIHLEERRSDHWQMLTHHFVTIGLLIFSYGFRMTRVGNAILVLMDTVDLVFPLAKCLRYIGLQTACDICFGIFVVSWVLTRHVAYVAIVYSYAFHCGVSTMLYGTYSTSTAERLSPDGGTNMLDNLLQPFLQPDAPVVQFNPRIQTVFLSMLGGLQVITCIWFVMIVKVVIRVLSGQGADDSRSDDEGESEEEEGQELGEQDVEAAAAQDAKTAATEQNFIEITADADDLYYSASRPSSSQRHTVTRTRSKGISSGLNLGGHKAILNRIGCLSEEQLARERERRRESTSPQPGSSKRV